MDEARETKTIRQILEDRVLVLRGQIGYLPAHDAGFISMMLLFSEEDEQFLRALQREPKGLEMLEALFRLCSVACLEAVLPKVRCWAELDNTRRGFLDVVDRWERVLRYGAEQKDVA